MSGDGKSIEQFEAEITGDGAPLSPEPSQEQNPVADAEVDLSPAEGEEEVLVEGAEETDPAVETEAAETEDPKPDLLLEVIRENTLAAKRSAELYEKLAAEREEASKRQAEQAQRQAPSLEAQYQHLLNDRQAAAQAMQHPDINLDATDPNQVALFRNMVYNALLEERDRVRAKEVSDLRAELNGIKLKSQIDVASRATEASWAAKTASYDLTSESAKETAETLRAAVDSLVESGTPPDEAVESVLKPFLKLLPKKGASKAAAPGKTGEAAKGLAAAAVAGRGANRSQAFRRGTTTSTGIDAFERDFFRSN